MTRMAELITHTRWMTTLAAGLATATVSLPPIATTSVKMRQLGVAAFILLGLSAWCGAQAAKMYVAYQLPMEEIAAALNLEPERRLLAKMQRPRALVHGRRWALVQQLLFVAGSASAGVFLLANL